MTGRTGWSLNHFVVLLLAGAFALILIEVRFLHQEVLEKHAIAWTPIVYSGVMLLASVIGLALWDRGGRRCLFWAFAPALVIGPTGYWLHNEGQPLQGLGHELAAWTRPIGSSHAEKSHKPASKSSGNHGSHRQADHSEKPEGTSPHKEHEHAHEGVGGPPALAPLAIGGLGPMGMLACARRLQPDPAGPRND